MDFGTCVWLVGKSGGCVQITESPHNHLVLDTHTPCCQSVQSALLSVFYSPNKRFAILFNFLQVEDEAVGLDSSPSGPARCHRLQPGPGDELSAGSVQRHQEHPPWPQPAGQLQPHLLRSDV